MHWFIWRSFRKLLFSFWVRYIVKVSYLSYRRFRNTWMTFRLAVCLTFVLEDLSSTVGCWKILSNFWKLLSVHYRVLELCTLHSDRKRYNVVSLNYKSNVFLLTNLAKLLMPQLSFIKTIKCSQTQANYRRRNTKYYLLSNIENAKCTLNIFFTANLQKHYLS